MVICVFIIASIFSHNAPDLVILFDHNGGVDFISGFGRFLMDKNEGVTIIDENVNVKSNVQVGVKSDVEVFEAKSGTTSESESNHSTAASKDNCINSNGNNKVYVELMEICGRKMAASIPNPKQSNSSIGKHVLLVNRWDKYGQSSFSIYSSM